MAKLIAFFSCFLMLVSLGNNALAKTITAKSWPPITSADYDSKMYQFSNAEFQHGDVLIRVAQLKRISKDVEEPPFACRAWLQVVKSNKVVWDKFFDDIDPSASPYGLFIPHEQPSKDMFAIVKIGDYDGHIYMIKKNGAVLDTLGGFYLLSQDKQFLISQYLSDESGISVIDLTKGTTILTTKKLPYIHEWYKSGSDYLFTESEWLPENKGSPSEKFDNAYMIDINNKKIVRKAMNTTMRQSINKLPFTFDPKTYPDCVTNP
jgi:hypothetical protein